MQNPIAWVRGPSEDHEPKLSSHLLFQGGRRGATGQQKIVYSSIFKSFGLNEDPLFGVDQSKPERTQ